MLSDPGRLRYDPRSRRRVRRLSATLRPLLLPVALVVCAVVLADAATTPSPAESPTAGPAPPRGSVLVAVTPTDPAVLGLTTPGSLVDVYAAGGPGHPGIDPGPGAGTGSGPDGDPPRASLLVRGALVVVPPGSAPAGPSPGGALGPVVAPGSEAPGSAVTLAVDDDDAAVLAEHTGGGFVLAVRNGTPGGTGVTGGGGRD